MADLIAQWAALGESRYVCVANVHMVMEGERAPDFARVLEAADLVTPDGMPLVWMMRSAGARRQTRVAGYDLLVALLARASRTSVPVYFLGATPETLEAVVRRAESDFPGLVVAGAVSPPFRTLSPEEVRAQQEAIRASGARLVLVALGCPRQERWMAEHKGLLPAVTVGLGGAFPVFAGHQGRAPAWMRHAGLEWTYRLALEPGRLWRRYLSTNLPFIMRAIPQAIGHVVRRRHPDL
jgi:N-acetylglucosaminyldiphosphoundecaprenol N-acetyl-beta-D-mannosaminyltransferase